MAPLPPDPGLGELRALYADRVAQTIERFARGIVPPDLRQSLVAPVLRIADHVEGDMRFHAGRRYLGFEVLNRYGLVTTGIGAGAGLEGDPGRLWNLHCSIGLKSGSGFVASVDARLSGGLRPIAAGFPVEPEHVELAGRAEYRFGGPGPVAAVFVVAEAGRRIDGSSTGWTATAGLNARTRKGSSVPAAARISGFVDSDGNAGPAWMLGLSSPAILDFGVRLRGQGRHSFAGPGTVPGISDPFRGPGTAERAPSWLFVNSELVWRARALGFEAGEMIIVREVEVGPFLDLRLPSALPAAGEASRAAAAYGGSKSGSTLVDVSGPERMSMEPAGSRAFAGLVLSASVSFMGLAPVDFSISAGVDTATGAPGISISGGRLFPP